MYARAYQRNYESTPLAFSVSVQRSFQAGAAMGSLETSFLAASSPAARGVRARTANSEIASRWRRIRGEVGWSPSGRMRLRVDVLEGCFKVGLSQGGLEDFGRLIADRASMSHRSSRGVRSVNLMQSIYPPETEFFAGINQFASVEPTLKPCSDHRSLAPATRPATHVGVT